MLAAKDTTKEQATDDKPVLLPPPPFPSVIDASGAIQPDYSRTPARLDKHEGARFITQFYYPTSYRTLARAPIRNVLVNGRRVWTPQDLADYARAKLASAPPGWGGRSN
jgi:hypothetical protein